MSPRPWSGLGDSGSVSYTPDWESEEEGDTATPVEVVYWLDCDVEITRENVEEQTICPSSPTQDYLDDLDSDRELLALFKTPATPSPIKLDDLDSDKELLALFKTPATPSPITFRSRYGRKEKFRPLYISKDGRPKDRLRIVMEEEEDLYNPTPSPPPSGLDLSSAFFLDTQSSAQGPSMFHPSTHSHTCDADKTDTQTEGCVVNETTITPTLDCGLNMEDTQTLDCGLNMEDTQTLDCGLNMEDTQTLDCGLNMADTSTEDHEKKVVETDIDCEEIEVISLSPCLFASSPDVQMNLLMDETDAETLKVSPTFSGTIRIHVKSRESFDQDDSNHSTYTEDNSSQTIPLLTQENTEDESPTKALPSGIKTPSTPTPKSPSVPVLTSMNGTDSLSWDGDFDGHESEIAELITSEDTLKRSHRKKLSWWKCVGRCLMKTKVQPVSEAQMRRAISNLSTEGKCQLSPRETSKMENEALKTHTPSFFKRIFCFRN